MYLHTKFNIPSSKGSLIIATKLKAKQKFPYGCHIILLFLHFTKDYISESDTFFKYQLLYTISGPYIKR